MSSITEYMILKSLIYNNQYNRKVAPFLKEEYFESEGNKQIYKCVSEYVQKYGSEPTIEALFVELEGKHGINEKVYTEIVETLNKLSNDKEPVSDLEFLLEKTESFCRDQAFMRTLLLGSDILTGENTKVSMGTVQKLMQDALAITFDSNVGYDLFEDYKERYELETDDVKRYPFDINVLNRITNGGLKPKTLNVFVAGVHVGKTMFMCHLSKTWMSHGHNVLYISMEMAEEEIALRVVSNVLDKPIKQLEELKKYKKNDYFDMMEKAKSKIRGKLVVKQCPTSQASVINFHALLQELKTKKGFVPDIVVVDYINIVSPSSFSKNDNMYTKIKTVAEELRAFAIQNDVPVFSATQFNKEGQRSSDPEMTDTAESSGLPATCDLLWAGITNDDFRSQHKIKLKQLKNRYVDMYEQREFFLHAEYSKGRFSDTDETFNNTRIASIDEEEELMSFQKRKRITINY